MPKCANTFTGTTALDHEIAGPDGKKLGTLRVKPVGLGWKRAHSQKFHSVRLAKFIEWITDSKASGCQLTTR